MTLFNFILLLYCSKAVILKKNELWVSSKKTCYFNIFFNSLESPLLLLRSHK